MPIRRSFFEKSKKRHNHTPRGVAKPSYVYELRYYSDKYPRLRRRPCFLRKNCPKALCKWYYIIHVSKSQVLFEKEENLHKRKAFNLKTKYPIWFLKIHNAFKHHII